MAEVADQVIATLREQEPSLLANLRTQLRSAEDAVRDAERRLREPREAEWRCHRTGQWLLSTAEDRSFGRQPAPTPEPMPRNFSRDLLKTSLERHSSRPLPRTAA